MCACQKNCSGLRTLILAKRYKSLQVSTAKTVKVERHIPPLPENLDMFLTRFDEAYDAKRLSKLQRITSVAASHHRYVWIHPFLDGNGRVVRLMSYAALKNINVGSNLWSVARGLARQKDKYKSIL